jgi:hypothetical protein
MGHGHPIDDGRWPGEPSGMDVIGANGHMGIPPGSDHWQRRNEDVTLRGECQMDWTTMGSQGERAATQID